MSGRHPGRRSDGEITVCGLSGNGGRDTVIADLALKQAVGNTLGLTVPWSPGPVRPSESKKRWKPARPVCHNRTLAMFD